MLCALLALLALTLPVSAHAVRFKVESRPNGAVHLDARDTTRAEVLETMADEMGFEAVIQGDAAARRVARLTVAAPSLEDAVHEVLRGCNYALFYDDGDELLRVVVLPGASAARPVRSLSPRRPVRKGAAQKGPLVVRQ